MLKRARVAAALGGLTLSLFASAARAATLPIVGKVTGTPGVFLFIDGSGNFDGKTLIQQFQTLFAGTQWTVSKDGVQVNGADGKTLFTASSISGADDNSFFAIHTLVGSTFISGDFFLDSQDATKAYAILFLVAPSKDGKAFYCPRVGLQFTLSGGSTPAPPSGGGGFGNF